MVAVCVKEGAGTDPMVQDMSESTGMADIEELDIKRAQPRTKRRHKPFPGWLYAVLFLVFDFAAVAILQWGVTMSSTRVELSSPLVGLGDLIVKMFTKANFVLVLNMILVGVIYMVLLMLINRFWIATPVLLAVAIVIAVIEHFKIGIRYEAILPSDLGFLGSNNRQPDEFRAGRMAMGGAGRRGGVRGRSWRCAWASTASTPGTGA